ncbi:MAG: beta-ketoacyl-[acyl-carrier-protein] synthase family protein [Planctomycetota bacterium]|nr:MAG: beta-ketoacyl-[acyl-carrier-protein] synthase family protein [Planctomycetota bacterium]
MTRKVAVTGLGILSPLGVGLPAHRKRLLQGKAAIGELTLFDSRAHRTHLAGEVPADPRWEKAWSGNPRLSRSDRFALFAAEEALQMAGLGGQKLGPEVGVFLGSSTGGMLEGEAVFAKLLATPSGPVSVARLGSHLHSAPAEAVAREFKVRGPIETNATACSAASLAIMAALEALRAGECQIALAGGADALCQMTYGGFNALRLVDSAPCRPFRADREGLSLGEGAGLMVLESGDSAEARGVPILAWLSGAAASCDAHHMTAPDEQGRGPSSAIQKALEDAGRSPAELALINAHGTGTPKNDEAESLALRLALGPDVLAEVPIFALKAYIGHLLGACGGVEAVATVLALQEGRLYPLPGKEEPDPALGLRFARGKAEALGTQPAALSLNLAFGGANTALVFEVVANKEGRA